MTLREFPGLISTPTGRAVGKIGRPQNPWRGITPVLFGEIGRPSSWGGKDVGLTIGVTRSAGYSVP